jgi:hypothetical protein
MLTVLAVLAVLAVLERGVVCGCDSEGEITRALYLRMRCIDRSACVQFARSHGVSRIERIRRAECAAICPVA